MFFCYLFQARLLASAFESKLKKMLSSRNLSESALPAIAENLLKAAIDCSDKQSDGEGPPSFLMTELEGIYIQFQYAQRKIDESGNFKKFIVKNKYDLLSIGCIILMFSVNVMFAIPAIAFLVIDTSKSEY